MKNLQKGFIGLPILIAILLGIVVIGGGTYLVVHNNKVEQKVDNGSQNVPVTTDNNQNTVINPSSNQSQISTSNWKTYSNSEIGYSISYPPTYHPAYGNDLFNFDENLYEKGNSAGVKIQVQKTSGNINASKADVPTIKFSEKVTSGPGGTFDVYSVAGLNGTKYFQILVWGMENDSQNVSKILSTFQFVPTTPTNPSAGSNSVSNKITVSGMQQYTDSNFGFSFWYPNTWTVQNATIKNNYAGGTIQKTLTITPPNGTTGDAVTIDEFSSPTREITIAKDLCSPMSGSSVPTHRYYFDVSTHTWMVEVPAYTGQSGKDGSQYSVPASTKTADVSSNTMGGLHMLGAGCSGSVIPLSAKNFVVFSFYSRNVGPYYINIAKTITATDPSVATPVSINEQIQTITNAGVLLGAIGTKVGEWYVTSEHVYNGRGDVVVGANPSTFRLITTYSDGTAGTSYATDGVRVYSAWSVGTSLLSGADPATFIAIRQQYQIPYAQSSGLYGQSFTAYDTQFAKDKSHVWYQGRLIPNANPSTFVVTGDTHVENSSGGYTLAHDSNHSYGIDKQGKLTVDGVAIQ